MLVASETTSELILSSPFVVCRSNKRRRWRAAGVDDPGGSSSKWTPVKPSCSSTRNALLAGKRVLLVSLLRAKHELYDQGFQDLQLPSPRCLRAAKARLVCSLVCSADLVVSVWSLFKPPPPLKTQRPLWCSELRQPLAMITKGFHWEHVCRILSRFFFVCVWVFALEEVIGLEFPLVSPFVVGSFWGFTLFLMQSARRNWSASVAVSK